VNSRLVTFAFIMSSEMMGVIFPQIVLVFGEAKVVALDCEPVPSFQSRRISSLSMKPRSIDGCQKYAWMRIDITTSAAEFWLFTWIRKHSSSLARVFVYQRSNSNVFRLNVGNA